LPSCPCPSGILLKFINIKGYFVDNLKICGKCALNCSTCKDNNENCSECFDDRLSAPMCVCPGGTISDLNN
jgi:hypothetical protein